MWVHETYISLVKICLNGRKGNPPPLGPGNTRAMVWVGQQFARAESLNSVTNSDVADTDGVEVQGVQGLAQCWLQECIRVMLFQFI